MWISPNDSDTDGPWEPNMDRNFSSCLLPIPVSTKIFLSPVSMRILLMAQMHIFRSSAGLSLFQRTLGTTPNMGPPSSIKYPESTDVIFIEIFFFIVLQFLVGLKSIIDLVWLFN